MVQLENVVITKVQAGDVSTETNAIRIEMVVASVPADAVTWVKHEVLPLLYQIVHSKKHVKVFIFDVEELHPKAGMSGL